MRPCMVCREPAHYGRVCVVCRLPSESAPVRDSSAVCRWMGVDNAPLRDAFVASRLSAGAIARELGWFYSRGGGLHADTARVKRTLGLLDDVSRAGHRTTRRRVDIETVGRIADAMGLGRWEVGA